MRLAVFSIYNDTETESFRILIASIHNIGNCPCPRCLIPLKLVHNVGSTVDMMQRHSMARIDDQERRSLVSAARVHIYEGNLQVNSAVVEKLLQPKSLVPTEVSLLESTD